MEFDVNVTLDVHAENNPELIGVSKQIAKQIHNDFRAKAILTRNPKKAFLEMLKDYKGDSPKTLWLFYVYAIEFGRREVFSEVVEFGSEKVVQKHMSEEMSILLNSGASIAEIRQALGK